MRTTSKHVERNIREDDDTPDVMPSGVSCWTICGGIWLFVLTTLPLWFIIAVMRS